MSSAPGSIPAVAVRDLVREYKGGVRVLKLVHGRDQVLELLTGWEDAMVEPDSVAWLIERLRSTHTT